MESGCLGGLLRYVVWDIWLVGRLIIIVVDTAGKGYWGRFTFYFSDFSVGKRPSVALIRHLKIGASNEHTNSL